MERLVQIGDASFYVIYQMDGEEPLIYGIACAKDITLYSKGEATSFRQFDKIHLDEASHLTLILNGTLSIERDLLERIKKIPKSSGVITAIR